MHHRKLSTGENTGSYRIIDTVTETELLSIAKAFARRRLAVGAQDHPWGHEVLSGRFIDIQLFHEQLRGAVSGKATYVVRSRCFRCEGCRMIFARKNAKMLSICSCAGMKHLATGDQLEPHSQQVGKSIYKFRSQAKALAAAGRFAQPVASLVGVLLAKRPHKVAEIRNHLGRLADKKARNVTDRARQEGHAIKNAGPCMFGL